MALTDSKVKAAVAPEGKKQDKLTDGAGMYLLVKEAGKYWKYDYRYAGKRKTLSIGVYPIVSLKAARGMRERAKELLSEGVDPSQAKKDLEAHRRENLRAVTFEAVTNEWFAGHRKDLTDDYAKQIIRRFELNVFPWLGAMPIKSIKASLVLEILKRIAGRGAEETARRVKTLCSQVFRYAMLHYDLEQDPTIALQGYLKKKNKRHYACIKDSKQAGGLMRAMQTIDGTHVVKSALLLSAYVFLRPGELRKLEWDDIDFENKKIRLPEDKMKMNEVHIVPLSSQAIAILRDVKPLTGRGRYVFPSIRTNLRPISNNTVNVALRRLGYDKETMTAHGFRGMASTLLHERGFNSDFIERQLAHKEGNAIK
ncbi:MAG: tyrosine-type recombinase/integrase, partial [Ghiorsea sp.]